MGPVPGTATRVLGGSRDHAGAHQTESPFGGAEPGVCSMEGLMLYGKSTIVEIKSLREVRWAVGTRGGMRKFPDRVRWRLGRALYQAQRGMHPSMASPLRGNLRGVLELKYDHLGDAYRLYFTLKCPGAVYVLLCQKKKSKRGGRIPRNEMDLILQRFKDSLADCSEQQGDVH
jgi:phage-related protein